MLLVLEFLFLALGLLNGAVVAVVPAVAAVSAAAFGGASGRAAGNGVSFSGTGARKWCGRQCKARNKC